MLALLYVFILCFNGLIILSHLTQPNDGAFTLDLIHRDSPHSPLYNPKDTNFNRLRNAFHRSVSRINRFKPNSSSVSVKTLESDVSPGDGEYLMRVSVGTPPVEVLAIADTGSDLIWVQCQPCQLCYKQKAPIFDPRKSSTYHKEQCGSKLCDALDNDVRACVQEGRSFCDYTYSYGDSSFTNGYLSTDKFTIGSTNSSPVYLQHVVFGCGTRNGGNFDEEVSGLIGLGGGSLSLISQLGSNICGRFSYCLVHIESNSTSKIRFGRDSIVSGSNVVSTPLISKEPDTFYFLTLEALSVGTKKLDYHSSWTADEEKGNIIIDSGTTLTFLDSGFFTELESALEDAVKAKRVSDPKGLFSICFEDAAESQLPQITAHFTDANVKLQPGNTFVKADGGLVCFTMTPSNDIAIFGNLAQMNFAIGYDLEKKTVSFKQKDCSKKWYQ